MKYLTVVRHAKSSWDSPQLADHDRPLNERGRASAPAIARFLAKTYFGKNGTPPLLPMPEKLVSSTAVRAVSTAEIMCDVFGLGKTALSLDSRLYLADPRTLLNVVRAFDEQWVHAVIFAHNPGLHEFADKMLARTAINSMPTCTAAVLGLPHEFWGLADWSEAQLIAYITPKALERRFPGEFPGISKEGDD
jgi:phosphohistidine phosphatase